MIKNATEFVKMVENTLGWAPPLESTKPLWQVRSIEAGKVNRKIATNPNLYTWHNLELAVEYLRRRRQPVKSPVGVLFKVEAALGEANAPAPISNLGDEINRAIEVELSHAREGHEEWVGRLIRADGSARRDVLDTWRAERGPLYG